MVARNNETSAPNTDAGADPKALTHKHPETGKPVGPTDSDGKPWLTLDEIKAKADELVPPEPKSPPTERPAGFPAYLARYGDITIRKEKVRVDRWALWVHDNVVEAIWEKGEQRGPNDAGGSRDYSFQERETGYKFLANWYEGITTGRGGVRATDDIGKYQRTAAEIVAKRLIDAAIGKTGAKDVNNVDELSAETVLKFVKTACDKVEGGVQFPFVDQMVDYIDDDGASKSRKVSKGQNKVKAIGSLVNQLLESAKRGPILKAQAQAMMEAQKKTEAAGELSADEI